jgi:hypothetical protein
MTTLADQLAELAYEYRQNEQAKLVTKRKEKEAEIDAWIASFDLAILDSAYEAAIKAARDQAAVGDVFVSHYFTLSECIPDCDELLYLDIPKKFQPILASLVTRLRDDGFRASGSISFHKDNTLRARVDLDFCRKS